MPFEIFLTVCTYTGRENGPRRLYLLLDLLRKGLCFPRAMGHIFSVCNQGSFTEVSEP